MMKNLTYTGIAMLCALALTTACSNETEEAVMENQESTELVISATMGSDTRTTVAKEASEMTPGYYPVKWSEGDEIFIFGTTGSDCTGSYKIKATFPLTEGAGTEYGTFKGGSFEGDGSSKELQFALYPVPTKSETDWSFHYDLPTSYTYGDQIETKSPMYAIFGSDKTQLSFRQLCTLIRLRISGLAANPDKDITVTLTSSKDNFTGDACVTYNTDKFVLTAPTTGGKAISYTIPQGTINESNVSDLVLVLDFPVPSGDLSFTVEIVSAKNTYTRTQTRKDLTAGDMYLVEYKFEENFAITGASTGGFQEP